MTRFGVEYETWNCHAVSRIGICHRAYANARNGADFCPGYSELETVVVTDGELDKFETWETSVEINREEIEQIQPVDLKQLFQGTPSVTTAGGSPASQKFYVHGIDPSKLNVTVDGARQKNNVWHHNGNLGINPMFLKSIGINDGVVPADHGPGALGGSARFETVDAVDLLSDGNGLGGLLSFSYDTNSMTLSGTGAGYGAVHGMNISRRSPVLRDRTMTTVMGLPNSERRLISGMGWARLPIRAPKVTGSKFPLSTTGMTVTGGCGPIWGRWYCL